MFDNMIPVNEIGLKIGQSGKTIHAVVLDSRNGKPLYETYCGISPSAPYSRTRKPLVWTRIEPNAYTCKRCLQ